MSSDVMLSGPCSACCCWGKPPHSSPDWTALADLHPVILLSSSREFSACAKSSAQSMDMVIVEIDPAYEMKMVKLEAAWTDCTKRWRLHREWVRHNFHMRRLLENGSGRSISCAQSLRRKRRGRSDIRKFGRPERAFGAVGSVSGDGNLGPRKNP